MFCAFNSRGLCLIRIIKTDVEHNHDDTDDDAFDDELDSDDMDNSMSSSPALVKNGPVSDEPHSHVKTPADLTRRQGLSRTDCK